MTASRVIENGHLTDLESDLVGSWQERKHKLVPDPVCQRIQRLIETHLVELAVVRSGSETLYRDPNDGRLWELSWPQFSLPGGGPPRLTHVTADAARLKYGFAADG